MPHQVDAGMTFGLDARAAAEVPAGRGRYVRELLRGLTALPGNDRWLLYCREPLDLGLDDRFQWVPIGLSDPLWHVAAAHRASSACDAFLSTNSYLTAWFTRCPTVITVYDLVAFLPGTAARKGSARIERATIAPALRRAARLLCISAATRADLVERWPHVTGRAQVVPLAADASFRDAAPAHREAPYVLAVGTLEPRKNLERLLEAWAGLSPQERGDHELLLVGPVGWEADAILERAGSTTGVVLAGRVDDAELPGLYAGATFFAYPSLFEGFGLPVLEAMSAGTAVLTSDVSSLPEVAGGAALLIDPLDTGALQAGLRRLLTEPELRSRLAAAGRVRAAAFSWEATASATAAALRDVARGRRSRRGPRGES